MISSKKYVDETLKANNLVANKSLGQNFLVESEIAIEIVNSANIDKDTLVIEIGPGAGSLTYKTAEYAKNVLCYEIDTTLKELLEDNLSDKDNVEIIFKDFLKANVFEDINKDGNNNDNELVNDVIVQLVEIKKIEGKDCEYIWQETRSGRMNR